MAINVTSSTVDNVAMMDKPKGLTSIKGAARMCTQLAQLATDPHCARNALFVMALVSYVHASNTL